MNWKKNTTGDYFIIDSCIIQYLLSNIVELREKVKDLIKNLESSGNKLYISEYSKFEIIRGLNEERIGEAYKIFDRFAKVPLEEKRLLKAARYFTKLQNNPKTRSLVQNKSISDGDIHIGSLAMNEVRPKLLTADYDGFPRPFFHEYGVERISYLRKGKHASLYIYCLVANPEEN
jgi:predicted nucleic acid-binding protein